MIIGVKYWARGATVPASWTNLDVAECDLTDDTYVYDEGEAIDGEEWTFKRTKYTCRLSIDPLVFNDGTYGPVVAALRKADFARINDSRDATFDTSNTINFQVKGSTPVRSERSNLTRGVEITLRAVVTHT